MREPLKDRTRLEHIVEAIDNVADFIAGKTFDLLESDKILFFCCGEKYRNHWRSRFSFVESIL